MADNSERTADRRRIVAALVAVACAALIGVSAYALVGSGTGAGDLFQTTQEAPAGEGASADRTSSDASEDAASGKGGDGGASSADGSAAEAQGDGEPSSAESAGQAASSKAGKRSDSASGSSAGAKGSSGSAGAAGGSSDGKGASAEGSSHGGSQQKPTSKPSTVTVRVVVDSSAADGSVSASKTLTFEKGASAYDALCGLGLTVNASQSAYGVYVSGIGGLAEKTYGGQDGWKYSVNGTVPGMSCSSYKLSDGDVVRWFYALDA